MPWGGDGLRLGAPRVRAALAALSILIVPVPALGDSPSHENLHKRCIQSLGKDRPA
jgi:hypothetical protein